MLEFQFQKTEDLRGVFNVQYVLLRDFSQAGKHAEPGKGYILFHYWQHERKTI